MNNATVERSIVGALIADPSCRSRVLSLLQQGDFAEEDYRELFVIVKSYHEQDIAFDLSILSRAFAARRGTQDINTLHAQMAEIAVALDREVLASQINILITEGKQRQLVAIASNIGAASGRPVDQEIQSLQVQLKQLEARTSSGFQFATMNDIGAEAAIYLDYRSNHIGELVGLPYGIAELDKITQGAQDSELVIIAGRPAMGKTSMALNILPSMCARRKGLLFSAEMPARTLYFRMASQLGKINLSNIISGDMSDSEWARYTVAMGKVNGINLIVDDTPNIRYQDLISRAREAKRVHGIGFVVGDYMQLFSGHSGDDKGIAEVSAALKGLARELKIPVIMLSQLNRELERRPDKRPIPADLRGSGSIEQDADVIMMLYRHVVYKPKCRTPDHAEIIIRKQKNGPIGTVDATFDDIYASFSTWHGGSIDVTENTTQEFKGHKATRYSRKTYN